MRYGTRVVLGAVALGGLFAGSTLAADKKAAKPAAVSDADKKEAEAIFVARCAPCHGEQGMGNGVASVSLDPKPRNYTDAKWQVATPDESILKIIVGGGPSVGKSPLMPPNPDLETKPGVLRGLLAKIRAFNIRK